MIGRGKHTKAWIDWLVSLPGYHEYCVPIPSNYISDRFNLNAFSREFKDYEILLKIIKGSLDGASHIISKYSNDEQQRLMTEAVKLYGLIHQRYLTTSQGLQDMHKKFANNKFASCPRVLCGGIHCLPYGESEIYGESRAVLFCPNCNETYEDESLEKIDGAFFGPSWVHLFFSEYDDVVPEFPAQRYEPRIFGMKLSKTCKLTD